MKIKGIFIIPLIAIMIALFTIGVTPGFASDTTAGSVVDSEQSTSVTLSDTLTFIPTTEAPTSSFEEEVEGVVSGVLGGNVEGIETPVRGFSTLMEKLLTSMRNILNSIIRILEISGGMLGGGNLFGDDLFGGLLG